MMDKITQYCFSLSPIERSPVLPGSGSPTLCAMDADCQTPSAPPSVPVEKTLGE